MRLSRSDATLSAYDSREGTARLPLLRLTLEVELRSLGYEQPRKIYAVYYGGGSDTGECFGGSYPPSRVGNIAIAVVKRGTRCEEARNLVFSDGTHAIAVANLHEAFHTMGLVGRCAPHHNQESGGHVIDDPQDIMSASFPRALPLKFDAGRDDYYGHGNPACLDLASSPFLLPAPAVAELPPLWPVGAAQARACAEEASLRPEESAQRSGVVFDNMSNASIQLFQLTAQGRTLRDTLRPWIASYQGNVSVGSAWLAADASGNCLAIFVAQTSWTRASLRPRT
ncbi:MAG: hypothetical protein HY701_09640 [Gemmatimonadetes bacterium]|nr:hypothetical protein [Gemmatimonadota bacterium]